MTLHFDGWVGLELALASTTQTLPTTYTYDPFGGATTAGSASSNPYQFAGQASDGTRLDYDNARYYWTHLRPQSGQLLTRLETRYRAGGHTALGKAVEIHTSPSIRVRLTPTEAGRRHTST